MTKLVSTLVGAELALWVGRARGWKYGPPHKIHGWPVWRDESGEITGPIPGDAYRPDQDWSQAGPLIEQYTISIGKGANQITYPGWHAAAGLQTAHGYDRDKSFGPTPLVAAMRALVASVYGKEVPNEENT